MAQLHAHIEWEARDCDGLMSGSYVLEKSEGQAAREFGDLEFHNMVAVLVMDATAVEGSLTVNDGELEWRENTEEGFSRKSATFCTEDGCDTSSTRRDHQAEAAGY